MTWSEVPKPILPNGFPATAYLMFDLGSGLISATKNGNPIKFGDQTTDIEIHRLTLDDMRELLKD